MNIRPKLNVYIKLLYTSFADDRLFRRICNNVRPDSVDEVMMMMMNCFCGMVDRRKAEPYFQPGLLSETLTIANLRHAASRI